MRTITAPSVMKAIRRMLPPQRRQRSGSTSYIRAIRRAQARAPGEDGCTGHFWESRFRSQALLDERAITAAMAYVDLNPIRAGIAQTLQGSEYTSIAQRLCEPAATDATPAASESQDATAREARGKDRLKPIAGLLHDQLHSISSGQYIELVAWSATLARPGKHHLESPSAALKAIGCDEAEWKEQLNAVRCGWRVIGGSVQMRELAQRIGQQRFKRRSRRPDPDRDAAPRVDSG